MSLVILRFTLPLSRLSLLSTFAWPRFSTDESSLSGLPFASANR